MNNVCTTQFYEFLMIIFKRKLHLVVYQTEELSDFFTIGNIVNHVNKMEIPLLINMQIYPVHLFTNISRVS